VCSGDEVGTRAILEGTSRVTGKHFRLAVVSERTATGGPVLAQVAIAVQPGDTPDALAARLLAHEHRLLVASVAAIAAGRLSLGECGVLHDGSPLASPLRLVNGELRVPAV
jgi:folate-dependent phosphoribosylglycinamide formyltransferase PurN